MSFSRVWINGKHFPSQTHLPNVVFPLPDSYSDSYSDNMQKGSAGPDFDGHSFQCKVTMKITFKKHLISTGIGVKLGTVPICIRIGIGSVETVLHINILAI